jgi:hypothetical protein
LPNDAKDWSAIIQLAALVFAITVAYQSSLVQKEGLQLLREIADELKR